MLKDSFNRAHNYLRISLTEKCNLRCTYCMPEEGIELSPKNEIMTYEEVIQFAKIFVGLGVNKIRITGGEPLVRKDVDFILLELAKLPVELCLTTNGILIDKHINTFKKAKLTSINVSIDSLVDHKYKEITKRDQLDKVLQNINLLIQNDFKVKMNVVLIKNFNDQEVIDFIKFTKQRPLIIQFIEFMPFDGNQWDRSSVLTQQEILDRIQLEWPGEIISLGKEKNGTSNDFKIKSFEGRFSIISSVSNPFCDGCNRIRLTANGRLKNCLFSSDETDLLTMLRTGKDVSDLIFQTLNQKQFSKGGWPDFEKMAKDVEHENRSMILIGG